MSVVLIVLSFNILRLGVINDNEEEGELKEAKEEEEEDENHHHHHHVKKIIINLSVLASRGTRDQSAHRRGCGIDIMAVLQTKWLQSLPMHHNSDASI